MQDTEFDYQRALRLDGRCIVVLGSGEGLGSAIADALTQVGAQVVCVDRDAEVARLCAKAVGGYPIVCDVTDEAAFRRMLEEAERERGPVRGIVDVIAFSKMGPLETLTNEDWNATMAGVVGHAFLAVTVGAEFLRRAGGGSMVFIGSNSGLGAVKGQAAYGSAKAALHHLVTCMGPELGPSQIRVNAVAPSFIKNPALSKVLSEQEWGEVAARIPLGRPAFPREIAGAALFLMSDLASHITGQTLLVDGGLSRVLQLPSLPWNRD
ncbi:SDR family NAD(P)-dependent oxidoreductase [Rhodococcus wratislaviensis]|uniref:SDR family NAD(P)-dependent oxidoreductase n=1 Tax=Rhodococcus wratislaviensis TaxID=44752 RepID=UPI00365909B7